ncbi:unnamed protein product [Linum tenue]|uniref:RNase H type-1 domain-containing protein n=2 Tax=Linum tenue TaxID=586396 RepID=A0AAV0HDR0_9ROSI|nr:unnamed protein product [Linum tenue]CAI0467252.1 unnamed protein product [Linum tenue]
MEEMEIVPWAEAFLDEYRLHQSEGEENHLTGDTQIWKRPQEGRLKINTDAGIGDEGVGLGVVVRNHMGEFVMAAAKQVRGIQDPTMGEALAVEFGLQLARQHHMVSPIMEVDCVNVVAGVRRAAGIQTELGVICRNISKLLEETGGGTIQHVSRKANEAAHIMAHVRTLWDRAEVWFDRPPLILLDQLKIDDVTFPYQ